MGDVRYDNPAEPGPAVLRAVPGAACSAEPDTMKRRSGCLAALVWPVRTLALPWGVDRYCHRLHKRKGVGVARHLLVNTTKRGDSYQWNIATSAAPALR